jgi:uncharacterized protein
MKLDLSEIVMHVGMRYSYDVEEPPIVDEDIECTRPYTGNLVFTNTGNVLLIRGEVQTRVALQCSRCLTYFEEPLRFSVEEQFAMHASSQGPRAHHAFIVIEEDENPDAGKLFEGHLFDLTELLRQETMLELPLSPLHDPDCKGMCTRCGQNWNEGSCDCQEETFHPLSAQLGALLNQREKEQ